MCTTSTPLSSYPRLQNQSFCAGQWGRRHEYGAEGETEDIEFNTKCADVYVSVSDFLKLAVNLTLFEVTKRSVCVCVCVCACVCACTHVRACLHACVCVCMCMSLCVHLWCVFLCKCACWRVSAFLWGVCVF